MSSTIHFPYFILIFDLRSNCGSHWKSINIKDLLSSKETSLVGKIEREKDKQASCSLLFCIFEDKSN